MQSHETHELLVGSDPTVKWKKITKQMNWKKTCICLGEAFSQFQRQGTHSKTTLASCKFTHFSFLRVRWRDGMSWQKHPCSCGKGFWLTFTYLACASTPMTSAYRSATMCILPVLGPRYLNKIQLDTLGVPGHLKLDLVLAPNLVKILKWEITLPFFVFKVLESQVNNVMY